MGAGADAALLASDLHPIGRPKKKNRQPKLAAETLMALP